MARLSNLPSQGVIDGLAGVVDYYVYHPQAGEGPGIPCARAWPRYLESNMTEAARAWREPFTYINQLAAELNYRVKDAYRSMAGPTRLTWKDMATRHYLNGDLV